MSGLLGMSQSNQQIINARASSSSNTFPLKRGPDTSMQEFGSPIPNSQARKGGYGRDSPNYETDVSTQYYGKADGSFVDGRSNNSMWGQTPTKNKYGGSGAPGNRSSQPQQRHR